MGYSSAMPVASFRELTVWQKPLEIAGAIYRLTRQLPSNEQFGLISQIQRSAVSIPSNIAEGQQRNSRKEYRQFLGIARGSAAELETQLLLASEIYAIDAGLILDELHQVQKMLHALSKRLEPTT